MRTPYTNKDYIGISARRMLNLRRKFTFSLKLSHSLQLLSEHEERPVQELAEELLTFAVEQKQAANVYWQCWNTLTPRQQEVTVLLSRGYSNHEIAAALVISVETAKTHVRNVLHKFQLHKREHLRTALGNWDFNNWEYL